MLRTERIRTPGDPRLHRDDAAVVRKLWSARPAFFVNRRNRIWHVGLGPKSLNRDVQEIVQLEKLVSFGVFNPTHEAHGLTDDCAPVLAMHPRICSVCFRNCPNISNESLIALIRNPWIRWLDFGGPKITDELSDHFQNMQHIIMLNLSYTSITDDSVERFGSLVSLRKLRLVGCEFSPAGITRIRELLPGCTLIPE